MTRKLTLLLLAACLSFGARAQQLFTLSGTVTEKGSGEPVEFATVVLATGQWGVCDAKGAFTIAKVPGGNTTVTVSCVGYVEQKLEISVARNITNLKFSLPLDNLSLEGAVVTAQESTNSATTSRTIDKTALDHVQLMNVSSISSLMPGGATTNPNLTSEQQFNIRGGSAEAGNASFGTAVEVDGVRLSNNAAFGQLSSTSQMKGAATNNIASTNIESVEVISGVPSVEYGDMTSGVVKINTKKGKTPWTVTMSTSPNTKQLSASKGFGLGEAASGASRGVLNASAEYTRSVSEPMSPYTAYDLYVGGLRVNDHNCYDIDGTGKLKYDDATHTLTVGGDITATEGCAIESQLEELRVELKGNIGISTTAEGAAAIKTDGDLILHGTGNNTLTLTGAANAIRMTKGSLGISFVTVSASGHRALEGNNDNTSCHLAIYGRDLTATSDEGEPAISGFRNGILLSGCEITEPAGGKIQNGAVVSADGQTASHVVISRLNNFPITVDNVAVSTSNCDDILGNGIFSYDADLQTLYVNGSYETTATNLIYSTLGDLTICTEAEAELKSGETVIVLKGNTALTGSARLSLVAPQKGIEMSSGGKLTLDGANIYVSGKYGLSGNVDRDVTLYISNARVEIESTMRAIYEFHGGIELEDCEITLPEGGRVSNGEIVNSKGNTAKKVTIEPTGAATAIEHGAWNAEHASDGWYTLGGQRLDSQPTRPGIYLHGSHKIVVR